MSYFVPIKRLKEDFNLVVSNWTFQMDLKQQWVIGIFKKVQFGCFVPTVLYLLANLQSYWQLHLIMTKTQIQDI